MRIKFTQSYKVKDAEGREYAEGQEVDFPDDHNGRKSAWHFLNRQVATQVEAPKRGPGRPPRAESSKPEPPKPEAGPEQKPEVKK